MIWVLSHTWIRWHTDSISKKDNINNTIVEINCDFKQSWNRINVNIQLTISKAKIYILTVICSPNFYLYLPLAFNPILHDDDYHKTLRNIIIEWSHDGEIDPILHCTIVRIKFTTNGLLQLLTITLDNSCSTRVLGQCDTIYLLNLFH